jgi:hypothetical protein
MNFTAFLRCARMGVRDGIRYLVSRQSSDGFWRDYNLPPGMSESWSTAWVGWCITQCGSTGSLVPYRAAVALRRCSRESGWGYNRNGSTDADSTAWTIRFLRPMGGIDSHSAVSMLQQYLDTAGRAHTFLSPEAGSWSFAHDDVTPVVGLGLLSAGASLAIIKRVRTAVLTTQTDYGAWRSFWWSTDTYATAWSLRFLAHSGGVPDIVKVTALNWLRQQPTASSALELSLRLFILNTLGLQGNSVASELIDSLLDTSRGSNGWPPSRLLRVPDRTAPTVNEGSVHADCEALMTTGIVCTAISEWVRGN